MGIIYLEDIAPYNEYDHASNGGFFNCPSCNEQQYVSSAESGDNYKCDCGEFFKFE